MRRIVSSDSRKLSHSAEKVFDAVSDVTVYKDWWSSNVKIKVLNANAERAGSQVEIRASGGWFRCEIVSMSNPDEVRIKYYEGVQLGEGIWKVEKTGENETMLTYDINLEPNGIMPRLLSNFINFSKIHSKAMKGMFAGLDRYLSSDKQL
jgi:ribosome-associated toxin RatA of RatAB toxin-antitoxin module